MATREDIGRCRRSVAMLAPSQPAGLSREDAMELLAEVRTTRQEVQRLIVGVAGSAGESFCLHQ